MTTWRATGSRRKVGTSSPPPRALAQGDQPGDVGCALKRRSRLEVAVPVVTEPMTPQLSLTVQTQLTGRLGRAALSSAVLVVLFIAGAVIAVVVARRLWPLGLIMAVAYLAGAVLSIGVLTVARHGRRAAAALSLAEGRRSGATALGLARLSRYAAVGAVLVGIALALGQDDAGLIVLGFLCGLPLLSLAFLARGVARGLTRSGACRSG
jgi:hypothetical protein